MKTAFAKELRHSVRKMLGKSLPEDMRLPSEEFAAVCLSELILHAKESILLVFHESRLSFW